MHALLTRDPDPEEFKYLSEKELRLDLSSADDRKKANECLILFYDVNRGRAGYMEAAKRHGWPSYHQVKKARESVLYPRNVCYGNSRVEVSLADLMSHSTGRILEYLYEENPTMMAGLTEMEKMSLGLWAKVGGDGQGDHKKYNQKNRDPVNGSSVFSVSYVPLQLKALGKLLWVNEEPNSPSICMPLIFQFVKETDELVQCEERKLRAQIENLADISVTVGMSEFCLKSKNVKVYSTMWDGKCCTSIARTYLKGRKLASNTCHVCLATPKDMNKPGVWKRPIAIPEMLDYSCTVMHMWIRCMEFLFSMSIKTKLYEEAVEKARKAGQGQILEEIQVPALTCQDGDLIKAHMKVR
jgi:hypothetical protein